MTGDSIKATARFRERGIPVLIAIGLLLITIALFWPATRYGFIDLDDYQYVLENDAVTRGLHWDSIRWAFNTVHGQWWLPLLWISYMADTDLFGPAPFGYHLTNVLMHGANAALLFWALFRMTKSRWQSAFVAALFAVHPLRIESVAWITERKDVLSGLFFMLALIAYVRYVERPSRGRSAWVSVSMLGGLLSKGTIIVLPFVLLLLDYWPLRRAGDPWGKNAWKPWRALLEEKLPLFCLTVAFMIITQNTHIDSKMVSLTLLNRFALIAPNYWAYLGKIFWPTRLSVVYPVNDLVHWPPALAALAGLLILTLLFLSLRRRCPGLIIGWLWFLVVLFPLTRGIRLDPLLAYADRYTYIPQVGLGILLAWGACELWSAGKWKILPAAAGGIVLAVCMLMTHRHLPFWKDSMTLFSQAIQLVPQSPPINNCYGLALYEDNRRDEGLIYVERAVQLDPANPVYLANKAVLLANLNRFDEAMACYRESIRLDPNVPKTYNNMGNLLAATGKREEAISAYQNALQLTPLNAEAHYNLANLLFTMQRWQEALAHYQLAVQSRPDSYLNWYNLGITYAQLGQFVEARRCVEKAMQLNPFTPNPRQTLMRIQAELDKAQ